MGTPELAARILERLIAAARENFPVVGVVTRPDQPRGRGQKPQPSEVAAVAAHHGITTLKPTKIRTPEFLAQLKSFEPDMLVVAAYGRILPNDVLAAPRIMPINVHASLLPRHRGAAPIEGAILAGDRETGVTIMRVAEQMDAGAMLHTRAITIAEDETTGSLKRKLAELGAEALLEALDKLRRGELTETTQDESLATYTKIISKADALIDWRLPAAHIERMTRAYDPWPVARTTMPGAELLIYRAQVMNGVAHAEPGTIVGASPEPLVQCGEDLLRLVEVQTAGKKKLSGADFIKGSRLGLGDALGLETLVLEWLKHMGFGIHQISLGTGSDGGVDLQAAREGELLLVECKYSKTNRRIGVESVVQILRALEHFPQIARGMIVTSSELTAPAKDLAIRNGVQYLERFLEFRRSLPDSKDDK
jgi:methionyl-tRNA formyltransferase